MEEISDLHSELITRQERNSLRNVGILTLLDFLKAPKEVVVSALGIPEGDYQQYRQSVLNYVQPYPVTSRNFFAAQFESPKSTGIPSLDNLLRGGLFPGDVIELYGKIGSGKTQLCMYLAAQFCLKNCTSTVLYFDLKNDFYARRLFQFCKKNDKGLENVMVCRAANLHLLLTKLDDIKKEFVGGINEFYSRSKLLVIDCVPMVIYPDVVQGDNNSWRHCQEKLFAKLQWLADKMKLTVILVNHAVSPRAAGYGSSVGPSKPALGTYWQHISKTRILLSKVCVRPNRSNHSGDLEKSPRGPSGGSFYFCIKENSIEEVPVKS